MKTEKTKSKKALKIVIIIVAVICLFLLGIRAYFRLPVAEYYRNSEKSFLIPGISDGAVLQGLEYANGKFLVCGYMSDGSASKIYVVDGKNNSTEKKLLLQKEDGSAYTGHAGGVAVNGKYVYVADGSDKCLYVYLLADIDAASDGGSVTLAGWNGGYGNCIMIDHGNGYVTLYGHLSSISVSVGQTVSQGTTIGAVGSTGNSTGPHLHFEVLKNGTRIDPEQFFSGLTISADAGV